MSSKLRMILVGHTGRLGSQIKKAAEDTSHFEVIGIHRATIDEFWKALPQADLVVDASLPQVATDFVSALISKKIRIPYVIGSTGWSEEQIKILRRYAETATVVFTPNFSVAVTVMLDAVERCSRALSRLGFKIEIEETHHLQKRDKPSGTAKALAKAASVNDSQIIAHRIEESVGVHDVIFKSAEDQLTFRHEAFDRMVFARGALIASRWAVEKKENGFFTMKEVLFSK